MHLYLYIYIYIYIYIKFKSVLRNITRTQYTKQRHETRHIQPESIQIPCQLVMIFHSVDTLV